MATCVRCGTSRFGLRTLRCLYCTNPGCDRCMVVFGDVVHPQGRRTRQWVCSWEHFDAWAGYYVSHGHAVQPWGHSWALSGIVLDPAAASRALLLQARHYETAERLEDAARTYELIGMAAEAGELRRRARSATITQVQVDVNSLIEQIRKGGLSTTYTCPACRSPIEISPSTPPDALRSCGYCGSTIQTTDLVRFLSRIVRT